MRGWGEACFSLKTKLWLATRCQYMFSHKLAIVFTLHEMSKSKAVYIFYPDMSRKTHSVPSLSKETNKSPRIYMIRHRNRGMVGDLPSHLEPLHPFSASCQGLCYCRELAGLGELTDTSLLASLPLIPLPLQYPDCVPALRSSSFPSVTPNAATPLKRERERKTRTWKRETKNSPLPEDAHPFPGSREARPKASSCLPFCHWQRKPTHLLSLSPFRVLNSRYLTAKRHRQLLLLCHLKNFSKMKPSRPMGGNQLSFREWNVPGKSPWFT